MVSVVVRGRPSLLTAVHGSQAVPLPVDAFQVPLGQFAQALLPAVDVNLAAGQSVHADAPAAEYFPACRATKRPRGKGKGLESGYI